MKKLLFLILLCPSIVFAISAGTVGSTSLSVNVDLTNVEAVTCSSLTVNGDSTMTGDIKPGTINTTNITVGSITCTVGINRTKNTEMGTVTATSITVNGKANIRDGINTNKDTQLGSISIASGTSTGRIQGTDIVGTGEGTFSTVYSTGIVQLKNTVYVKDEINFSTKISSGIAPARVGSLGWDYGDADGLMLILYFSTSTAELGWKKVGAQ